MGATIGTRTNSGEQERIRRNKNSTVNQDIVAAAGEKKKNGGGRGRGGLRRQNHGEGCNLISVPRGEVELSRCGVISFAGPELRILPWINGADGREGKIGFPRHRRTKTFAQFAVDFLPSGGARSPATVVEGRRRRGRWTTVDCCYSSRCVAGFLGRISNILPARHVEISRSFASR